MKNSLIPGKKQNRTGSSAGRFIRTFAYAAAVLAAICMIAVYVFDPFFHYHKPWLGLSAVQTQKEYQVVGVLRHFDYDAVNVGSSVIENNNNAWFDAAFDCTTVKAPRSYGGMADLCAFLDIAYESHDLRYVFFNLDPASITGGTEVTFQESGFPMYLYDQNPFNDVQYLLNKSVLLEDIPYMVARSLQGYDENLSYNWAEGKEFGRSSALSHYYRIPDEKVQAPLPENVYDENLEGNLRTVRELIEAHPQTQFYFYLPPYSILWWDAISRAGETDAYLHCEETAMRTLASYDNVHVYDFQNADEIVSSLDYYMDSVHFSPKVNEQICDWLVQGQYAVTGETAQKACDNTRHLMTKWQDILDACEKNDEFLYDTTN